MSLLKGPDAMNPVLQWYLAIVWLALNVVIAVFAIRWMAQRGDGPALGGLGILALIGAIHWVVIRYIVRRLKEPHV